MQARTISLLCLGFLLASCFADVNAQMLIPYKKGKLWGYADTTRKIIIEPVYEEAEFFKNGRAIVRKDKKFGMIDASGKVVIPLEYEKLSRYYHNRALFQKDGLYGYLYPSGEVAIEAKFKFAFSFFDWPTTSVKLDSLYGFIDTTGKIVIPYQYQFAMYMSELGYASVRQNDKYGMIDAMGNLVVPYEYDDREMHLQKRYPKLQQNFFQLKRADGARGDYGLIFNTGDKLAYYKTGQIVMGDYFTEFKYLGVRLWEPEKSPGDNPAFALIDIDGKIVCQTEDYRFMRKGMDEGLIIAKYKGKDIAYGLINPDGKTVVKPKYEKIESFVDGKARVFLKDQYGFIDASGELVVPLTPLDGRDLGAYKYGVMRYEKGEEHGLLQYDGTVIFTQPKSVLIHYMDHGFLRLKKDNQYQLIHPDGKPVHEEWYDKIHEKKYGFYVEKDGKAGAMNKLGKVMVEPAYVKLKEMDSLYFEVQVDGKWGVIDHSGKVILPAAFSELRYVRQSGNFWVRDGGKWKMVNTQNEQIHDQLYGTISYCTKGYYNVYKSRWGVVDPNGKLVVPLVCRDKIASYRKKGIFGEVRSGSAKYGYIGEDFTRYFEE